MKRLLCALLALSLLTAPALAQGYKLDFIDEQGVYLEVLTTEWKEDKLRFDVVVDNNTGREIDLRAKMEKLLRERRRHGDRRRGHLRRGRRRARRR